MYDLTAVPTSEAATKMHKYYQQNKRENYLCNNINEIKNNFLDKITQKKYVVYDSIYIKIQ